MVAVVVILAAVIGAFVLGLGGDQNQAPQASFSLNGESIVYGGGDNIDPSNIAVVGSDGTTISDNSGSASNSIVAGEEVGTASGTGTVRIVWSGDGGSITIWQTNLGGGGGGDGT